MKEPIGKQMPSPSKEMREASAKEYRDQFRKKNRKERRAVLADIRKVERGDYS